jgi:hypothetical protein
MTRIAKVSAGAADSRGEPGHNIRYNWCLADGTRKYRSL